MFLGCAPCRRSCSAQRWLTLGFQHPAVNELIARVEAAPEHELAGVLAAVQEWSWPRTDLQYWSKALNRFDTILETVCNDYHLPDIQLNDFTPKTKELVVEVLRFTRLLLENATNKKLYASHDVSSRPAAFVVPGLCRVDAVCVACSVSMTFSLLATSTFSSMPCDSPCVQRSSSTILPAGLCP
jgi:hypothetical protein